MIGNQLIVHARTVPDLLVLGHAESQAGRRLRRSWSQVSFFCQEKSCWIGSQDIIQIVWQNGIVLV